MKCTIISPDDYRWASLIKQKNTDIYDTPCYCKIEGKNLRGKPGAFYYEEDSVKVLIPFISREIPDFPNLFDAVSPYGYPGIIISNGISNANFNEIVSELKKCCARNGIVTAFLRLHPILNNFELKSNHDIKIVRIGNTVAIDCSRNFDEIYSNFRENHRQNIKRLRSCGYTLEIDRWSDYDSFQTLYFDTMNRVNANSYYFFNKEYFSELKECLSNNLHLITVKNEKQKIVSAGLFSSMNKISHSLFTGTDSKSLRFAPSKLLFYGMIKWCCENKINLLNLGGGVGSEEDSLYYFKKGFSNIKYKFRALQMINDSQKFEEICNSCEKFSCSCNFFPCYRAEEQSVGKLKEEVCV